MEGKLINFRLVGEHYKSGFRYPGFIHLIVEDATGTQRTLYKPKGVSLRQACDELNKQGYDTSIADNWVKNGKL